MFYIRIIFIGFIFISAGCSTFVSDESTKTDNVKKEGGLVSEAAVDRVVIRDYRFSPQRIVVKVGTVVSFVNDDGVTHTVTPLDGLGVFGGKMSSNQILKHRFDKIGKYPYRCDLHPFMTGVVEVVD